MPDHSFIFFKTAYLSLGAGQYRAAISLKEQLANAWDYFTQKVGQVV